MNWWMRQSWPTKILLAAVPTFAYIYGRLLLWEFPQTLLKLWRYFA